MINDTSDRTQTASLGFLKWQPLYLEEKPFEIMADDIPPRFPTTNLQFEQSPPIAIHDMRPYIDNFTLRQEGIALMREPIDLERTDAAYVEQNYLTQLEPLLRDVVEKDTGEKVVKIIFFEWRFRTAQKFKPEESEEAVFDFNDKSLKFGPAGVVHVDQSSDGALIRLNYHCPEEYEELSKLHFQIINIWRPVEHTVYDWPLAVCEGGAVSDQDLVTSDYVRRTMAGEVLFALYNPNYRFHYLSQHTKEELLLFKIFDSDLDAPARCCPYSSFQAKDVPADSHPPESLEVRAMVFSS